METTATALGGSTASSVSKASGKSEPAAAASDFETFLTLLTAQMRSQDPLNPMDATQFVAQLADFSAVEQQVQTNSKLDQILGALSGATGSSLSDWIGKEALAETSVNYTGDPIDIAFEPGASDQTAVLKVVDAGGKTVATLPVDPSAAKVTWSGEVAGGKAPEGMYRFVQERTAADATVETLKGKVYSTVTEVRMGPGGSQLVLSSGDTVAEGDVSALRRRG